MDEPVNIAESNKEKNDFESMYLQPGTRLQFLTHRNHKPAHFVSMVVGLESGSYVLIKQPREQGTFLNFFDGEKLTMRVFSGTAICTFDTTVIKTINHPLYCLCVTFPASIRAKQLRREMRIKVTMEASIDIAGKTEQVRLNNLSATGCLLQMDAAPGSVGEQIKLTFALPFGEGDETYVIDTNAVIRNVSEVAAEVGSQVGIGIEFDAVGATELLLIRNYVYEMLLDGRRNIV